MRRDKFYFKLVLLLVVSFLTFANSQEELNKPLKISFSLPESIKGTVKYKDYLLDNPLRLVIDFTSDNIFAEIDAESIPKKGIVKEIKAIYDTSKKDKDNSPLLKSLVFYLTEKPQYHIEKKENKIIVEFKTTEESYIQTEEFFRRLSEDNLLANKTEEVLKNIEALLKREIKVADSSNLTSSSDFLGKDILDTKEILYRRDDNRWLDYLLIFLLLAIFSTLVILIRQIIKIFLLERKFSTEESFLNQRLVVKSKPDSSYAEAYRLIRANILSLDPSKTLKTLFITSALSGEGKTTIVANLSMVFAQMGSKVLLVDSDFRNPLIHRLFDIEQSPGLAEILNSNLAWTAALNNTDIDNLHIITSGKVPLHPSNLLDSAKLNEIINEFKLRYDIVFFDSPQILEFADASVMGKKLDAAILVVQAKKTQREVVFKAKTLLEQAKIKILGCILTQTKTAIPYWLNQLIERYLEFKS